ncbi:O-methyltransferase [Mycolicibacterium goodii]|uniref:O-methyltransferase n=1 Tax=Mycolicibacterium goodii TaxID=134601 RepID=UPI001BDBEBF9|nr:class I SAM-dependent methyltransferase [Mycolicibacterium goodii]MBU8810539.1 class I SAM-dependent methyltransferase [Mycolicibacterium goodii]MBU8814895.1 class I SAM-dependent methyltransferase [Mycolicibacterium goodii]MBU8829901.1 class I SAM-dependent methyltransferase [Mycolicibacterium goodii]ULN45957.1 class I SAM-dependent methyltransferase [Mycolicibacterium goodii]
MLTRTLKLLSLKWITYGGWIADLPGRFPPAPQRDRIEAILAANHKRLGPQQVAEEYDLPDAKFTPREVSSPSFQGDVYAWLVMQRKPKTVIEFGSGFGVSGMFFGAGLEANQSGHLYSFEINDKWADVAEQSIAQVTKRFTLTRGAFEEHVKDVPGPIDLAFVDGIHTYDFVMQQWDILKPLMAPGGLVLFDDITYGQGMHEAWLDIARSDSVAGAVEFRRNRRLGLVEVR